MPQVRFLSLRFAIRSTYLDNSGGACVLYDTMHTARDVLRCILHGARIREPLVILHSHTNALRSYSVLDAGISSRYAACMLDFERLAYCQGTIISDIYRHSSAGRASALQAEGHRFKSGCRYSMEQYPSWLKGSVLKTDRTRKCRVGSNPTCSVNFAVSPSGKASDFDSDIRRFKSCYRNHSHGCWSIRSCELRI